MRLKLIYLISSEKHLVVLLSNKCFFVINKKLEDVQYTNYIKNKKTKKVIPYE